MLVELLGIFLLGGTLVSFALVVIFFGILILAGGPIQGVGDWAMSRELEPSQVLWLVLGVPALLLLSLVVLKRAFRSETNRAWRLPAALLAIACQVIALLSLLEANASANYGNGNGQVLVTASGDGEPRPGYPDGHTKPFTPPSHFKIRYSFTCASNVPGPPQSYDNHFALIAWDWTRNPDSATAPLAVQKEDLVASPSTERQGSGTADVYLGRLSWTTGDQMVLSEYGPCPWRIEVVSVGPPP